MQSVSRGELLSRLNEASVGVSARAQVERSDSFLFVGRRIYTFNEQILVDAPSPVRLSATVAADDLLKVLDKLPDEDIKVGLVEQELRIRGRNREAGIQVYDGGAPEVEGPSALKWRRLSEDCWTALQRCAKICSDDLSQYLTTVVHVTRTCVEACDNFRLLRCRVRTRIRKDICIPAKSLMAISGIEATHVSISDNWLSFRTHDKTLIHLRCAEEGDYPKLDRLLVMEKPESIMLPAKVQDIIRRAELFEQNITVVIDVGKMTITSRKDGGWYRESKKIRYRGRRLHFRSNASVLVELLARAGNMIQANDQKLCVETDGGKNRFVASIQAPEEVE